MTNIARSVVTGQYANILCMTPRLSTQAKVLTSTGEVCNAAMESSRLDRR
jgi:hypothetical protein